MTKKEVTLKKRIGICISGRGSNMLSILGYLRDNPNSSFSCPLVLCDNSKAEGIRKLQDFSIHWEVLEREGYRSREDHERAIDEIMRTYDVDFIVLAGYMRILGTYLLSRWQILNIHPSLLPVFKGLNTHERAYKSGVEYHGCTVHLVTDSVDSGAILAQSKFKVTKDDTIETLSRRTLALEHKLYSRVIADFARGKERISDFIESPIIVSEDSI